MFKYDTRTLRDVLYRTMLSDFLDTHVSDDVVDYVEGHFYCEEDYVGYFELLDNLNDLVSVSYEERFPPQTVQEELDYGSEHIWKVFHIPGLLPYINHPTFKEFIRNIEIENSGLYGDHVSMYYLPYTNCVTSIESTYANFANQPATLAVVSQDMGSLDVKDVILFVEKFRVSMKYLEELIEGRE